MLKPILQEPGYFADANGDIWSDKRRQFKKLTPQVSKQGYLRVYIIQNGQFPNRKFRHAPVHHLVLLAFCGLRPNNLEGSHLNGIKTDNRPENLVWETHSENARRRKEHGTGGLNRGEKCNFSKLKTDQVIHIKEHLIAGWTPKELAAHHSVSVCSVWFIRRNISWKHIPWPESEGCKELAGRKT